MAAGRTRRDRDGGILARAFAAVVIRLRWLIPLAWVGAAVVATISLPQLGAGGGAPLDDLIPDHSEAAAAAAAATQKFGAPLDADTAVVQANADGLTPAQLQRQLRAASTVLAGRGRAQKGLLAAIPVSNRPGAALGMGDAATTAVTYLIFDPELTTVQRTEIARSYAENQLGGAAGGVIGVTGVAPAEIAETSAIEHALPWIEAGSVVVVLLIVGLAFGSIGAPLITLGAGAITYLLMVRLVPWAGDQLSIAIPAQVQPVLVALLLGLVTDYSIFFLAGMRRRLRRGDERLPAARASIIETAPLVFAAALIVAAGTAALLVAKLDFFRAFGPGLALTTICSVAVAATLVPALMAIFGDRLFRTRRAADDAPARARTGRDAVEEVRDDLRLDGGSSLGARTRHRFARPLLALRRAPELGQQAQTGRWRALIARISSARPVALVIAALTVAALLFAASGLRQTELGLTFISGLPADDEVKRAANAIGDGLAPGALAPTEIDLGADSIADQQPQLAALERLLDQQPGVAGVFGAAEQPPRPGPQVMVADDGNAVRLAVVFDNDPLGAPAIDTLRSLEASLPSLLEQAGLDSATEIRFAGQTALAAESVDAVNDDLVRVGILALIANLILLMLFLRAVVAPLYLLLASMLGLAATLGLTTYVFQGLLDRDQLTYFVPFAAAILLLALGSDYNVFVAGRIWAEARWRRLPEAIAVATPSAARAITIAGLALAASFALLAIVPLDSFREFAFVLVVGVLIDTFIVRSLLVPALTSLFGERAWWPGRRLAPLSSDGFIERVASLTDLNPEAATRASMATLTTLGERIDGRERDELARALPDRLAESLDAGEDPGRFGAEEFVQRVRRREDGIADADAERDARAVLTTLSGAVPGGLDYVRVQLTEDFDEFFANSAH
jgi:RND superfamily putative drug exporter